MSDPVVLNIHIDGAARGNPGPAAFAYVIHREGMPAIEAKGCLGSTTNNLAEYTALVKALEHAAELGADRLMIASDSELLVKQMNGEYRVKNEELRVLYDQARRLCTRFKIVSIRHVRRADNSRADQLCNEALDQQAGAPSSGVRSRSRPSTVSAERTASVREEALLCLRAAAAAWAQGNASVPAPDAVWEQLWSILEEHGVLARTRSR